MTLKKAVLIVIAVFAGLVAHQMVFIRTAKADCEWYEICGVGEALKEIDPTTVEWKQLDPTQVKIFRELDPSLLDWSNFDPTTHDPDILLGYVAIKIEDVRIPEISQEDLLGYVDTIGDIWEELRKGNAIEVAYTLLDPGNVDPLKLEFGPVCGSGVVAYVIPDQVGRADFRPACREHDTCYAEQRGQRECDKNFRNHLYRRCEYAYPGVLAPAKAKCNALAEIYYHAVRASGKSAYDDLGLYDSLGLPHKCINNYSLVDCKTIIGDPAELREKFRVRLNTYPYCIVDTDGSGLKSYETCESPAGGYIGEQLCRGLLIAGWDFQEEEVTYPEVVETEGTRRDIYYGNCGEHIGDIYKSELSPAVDAPTVPDFILTINEGDSQISGEITADHFTEVSVEEDESAEFSLNGPGFVTLVDNGDSSASLNLTPDYEDAGEYTGVVTVLLSGVEESLRVPIIVNNVNRNPSIDSFSISSIDEGQRAIYELKAADPDEQPVVFNMETDVTFVSLVDNGDGTAELTLEPDFEAATFPSRRYSLSVTATDPEGGTDQKTVELVVNNVNRAPELNLASQSSLNVYEGTTLVQEILTSDPDGQPVELTIHGSPHFAATNEIDSALTELRLRPWHHDRGTYSVLISAEDPEGAVVEAHLELVVRNALLPLRSVTLENTSKGELGIIELQVTNWRADLEAQVQILTNSGWQNVANDNSDRAWNQVLGLPGEEVRYAYGANAIGGTYRWVIHDRTESHNEGWAMSTPFTLKHQNKHVVVTLSLVD